MKRLPSDASPCMATNTHPGLTRRESYSTPLTLGSPLWARTSAPSSRCWKVIAGNYRPPRNCCVVRDEPSGGLGVDDACLFWMQGQSCFLHPGLHLTQRHLRLGLAAAQDDEVVGVAHQFPARSFHLVVEGVQI